MALRIRASLVALAVVGGSTFSGPAMAQDSTAAPTAQQIEGIVAIVNDEPISFSDVRQRAGLLLLSLGGQQPTQEQIQQLTSRALDQLIDEKLQLQEAAEYEVEVSDEDIARSINDLASQSGIDRDTLINSLLSAGINPNSLREQTRADIAWRRIMGGLYGSRIRISDNQIRDQLSRMRAAAAQEQYQVGEIFLFAPTDADKQEAQVAAASIREQLVAGAPFQVAAQRFSSAPTAAAGGDMGWVTTDTLDPALHDTLKAMDGPGITAPIVAPDGVYLLEVRGKRDPSETTTRVDLTRITVEDGSETALQAALTQISDCADIDRVVDADENLRATAISGIDVDTLGPEGRSMVMTTQVGQATDIFAQSGTLASMYVCAREDGVDNMPSRDQIENRLYGQQLGMISERSLRNLRREATIIRR
ncbi:MAG: peptidylprolyl isomerase [Pseudomonadota bacterium]